MKKRISLSGCLLILVVLLAQCQKPTSALNDTAPVQPSQDNSVQGPPDGLDPLNLPVDNQVNGTYMKAYLVAYESFKADAMIPKEKRKIENYELKLRQVKDFYFVTFLAKRLPSEGELLGGESAFGMDVMYTIRKTNYDIVSRKFLNEYHEPP